MTRWIQDKPTARVSELLVNCISVLPHSGKQIFGNLDQGSVLVQARVDKTQADVFRLVGVEVILVEDLEYDFSGSAASGHSFDGEFQIRGVNSILGQDGSGVNGCGVRGSSAVLFLRELGWC